MAVESTLDELWDKARWDGQAKKQATAVTTNHRENALFMNKFSRAKLSAIDATRLRIDEPVHYVTFPAVGLQHQEGPSLLAVNWFAISLPRGIKYGAMRY